MEIILDTLGGECGAGEAVRAGVAIRSQSIADIAFVGNPMEITRILDDMGVPESDFRIIPTTEYIEMSASVRTALRKKKRASILLAMEELAAGRSQAVVSAGHTGATVMAARNKLHCLPGMKRTPLCQILPCGRNKHFFLLDVGANVNAGAEDFIAFARLGHVAAKCFSGISSPRIGLLNIGTESGKGSRRRQQAERLLRKTTLNFIGNIEGNQIWSGLADVVLTDGITGNILLKSAEGLVKYILSTLRPEFSSSDLSKFQAHRYGGALLLGVSGICIICHGRSETESYISALKLARKWHDLRITAETIRFLREEPGAVPQ